MDRRDCNNCRHLSITEEEQDRLKASGQAQTAYMLKIRQKSFSQRKYEKSRPAHFPLRRMRGRKDGAK